jgi:FkbM family methyltransferase
MGREYDRQTAMVFRRVLRRDSVCLDVGAHSGEILAMMRRFAPAGRHHAFEALPHLAEGLRRRFHGLKVHNVAVSDEPGMSSFCFVENAPAWSGLQRRDYDIAEPRIREIAVMRARIDDLVPASEEIKLVKIDIEGGEYHALLGATNVFQRSRPYLIMEAGRTSTGRYGVTPDSMFELVTGRLGLRITTMFRWLNGFASYSRDEFIENWEHGPDFYFLGLPE